MISTNANIGSIFYSLEDLKVGREKLYVINSCFSNTYSVRVIFKGRLIGQTNFHKRELERFYIEKKEAKRKFPQWFI